MRKPDGLIRIIVVEYFHAVRHVGALTAALLANDPFAALAHCKDARSDLYYTGKWLATECERRLRPSRVEELADKYRRKMATQPFIDFAQVTKPTPDNETLRG